MMNNVPIAPVYNAGVIYFYRKIEKQFDEFGTLIRGEFKKELVLRKWFRQLGITAQDVYYSEASGKKMTKKVAIDQYVEIDVDWIAEINGKRYEIYRNFYAYKNNETEISLIEVKSHDD